MSRGVLYYNKGVGCLARMLVSLHSLRKVYQGDVALIEEGGLPDWFKNALVKAQVKIVSIPASDGNILVKKSGIWRHTPFDQTMFLDTDTLVLKPVDEFLNWVEEYGLVATKFCDWRTFRRRVAGRIRDWKKVDPKLIKPAINYGWATNTGIMGWSKNCTALPEYEALTALGLKAKCTRKMLDELAMQLLLPTNPHYLAGSEWNVSGLYGDGSTAKIIHFHGHKHCRYSDNCLRWKTEFFETKRDYFPDTHDTQDRSIERWLKDMDEQRKDLTIVTAVNPDYAERCRINLAAWMKTPGLRNQKFIVFVNGFNNAKEREFLSYPNVEVIRWDYPFQDANNRERMLAAFVFGTAKNVKTKYWLKLDCDANPRRGWFDFPNYADAAITCSPWSFTKMKGDPDAKEHWFHRLDKMFSPEAPLFTRRFDVKENFKVTHERAGIPLRGRSFCHFERTEFTKKIADVLNQKNGGRMAIPSHDTTAWYCASLWKERIQFEKVEHFVAPH